MWFQKDLDKIRAKIMIPRIDYTIKNLPRLTLISSPTLLIKSLELDSGVRIWIKRDDLIPVAFGGNKVRKAEFIFAQVLSEGFDTVVTAGAPQSNHARVVAIVAGMLGLNSYLIYPEDTNLEGGNRSLVELTNAEVLSYPATLAELNQLVEQKASELTQKGKKAYPIYLGGSRGVGIAAYALCYSELMVQARELDLNVTAIVHASSTFGTQAGLLLGKALVRERQKKSFQGYVFDPKVIGIKVSDEPDDKLKELVKQGLILFDKDANLLAEQDYRLYRLSDDPGYGLVSSKAAQAIEFGIKKLGILFDPVYSSKGFAGLLELIELGVVTQGDVVFIHTGGQPAFFARQSTHD